MCHFVVILSCIYLVFTVCSAANADDLTIDELKLLQSAANNSSHEYTECSGNYMILAQCMNNTEGGSGSDYSILSEKFLDRAIGLGEIASLKPEVISKRLEMSVNKQIDKMNGCQNIMIIWDQLKKCNSLAEVGFQSRLKAWINRLAHRFPEADPDKLTGLVD
jgi:hypothetical protein